MADFIINEYGPHKLIWDSARAAQVGSHKCCGLCAKMGYWGWLWYTQIFLDEYQAIPLCYDCSAKIASWAKKKFKSKEQTVKQEENPSEELSPRLVDTT